MTSKGGRYALRFYIDEIGTRAEIIDTWYPEATPEGYRVTNTDTLRREVAERNAVWDSDHGRARDALK